MFITKKKKIIAAIDLGTSEVRCALASVTSDEIKIIGSSSTATHGIASGAIIDVKHAEATIARVVSSAEDAAGYKIDKAFIALSGSQLLSENSCATSKIGHRLVREQDIQKISEEAFFEYKKYNREIIHLVPLDYKLDGCGGVSNPRMMSCDELACECHVISASCTNIRNITNCLKRCSINITNYSSAIYASFLAVAGPEDSEVRTVIIDIGAASSSIGLFDRGKFTLYSNIPIGGDAITDDICKVFATTPKIAERIKRLNLSFDSAEENRMKIQPTRHTLVMSEEFIKFGHPGELEREIDPALYNVRVKDINAVATARFEEIFEMISNKLDRLGFQRNMLNNVILVGASASINGIAALAENTMKRKTKIGYPINIEHLHDELDNPSFSTIIGTIIFGRNRMFKNTNEEISGKNIEQYWGRLVNWF